MCIRRFSKSFGRTRGNEAVRSRLLALPLRARLFCFLADFPAVLSFVNFAGCALVIYEDAGKRYSDKSIPLAICDTFGIRTENEWNMCKHVHTFSRKDDNII